MSPIMVSAHFAAYIWFTGQPEHAGKGPDEAMQFAHAQWPAFLKAAHPGLGRLLLKLADRPVRTCKRAARALAGHVPAAGVPQPAPARHGMIDQLFSSN